MSDLVLLSWAQMARLAPHFPHSRGKRGVHCQWVVSGIIYAIRNDLVWKDAPRGDGPHKTLYNRFVHWSRMGDFERFLAGLAAEAGIPERMMVTAPTPKRTGPPPAWRKRGPITLHRPHQARPEIQAARRL